MKKVVLMMTMALFFVACGGNTTDVVNDSDVETQDFASDADETADLSDEVLDTELDETVDETVDETIDETVDESADEAVDETTDDDVETQDFASDEDSVTTDVPEIVGLYNDNWNSFIHIDISSWHNKKDLSFAYTTVDNTTHTIIAQNSSLDEYNPDKFSRFDWTLNSGALYFCQTVFNAESAADALAATPADESDLAAGCSGFPWSEMEQFELIGEYSDQWGSSHTVSANEWKQDASLFHIEYFINEDNVMIAQNDSANEYSAGLWSRFDWVQHEGALYYCQTAYGAATFEEALETEKGDDTDPANTGCGGAFGWTKLSFAEKAGEAGSTAIAKDSDDISAWADTVETYIEGADVDSEWSDSSKAVGAAEGTSSDIVSLGRGGSITLSFDPAITNGAGADFAVFENGLSDTFLELGWVEVSTNGTDWVRFPAISLTAEAVGAFDNINPEDIDGFAGKYKQGFGTPFDLDTLLLTPAVAMGIVNLDNIGYVKIVDVVGDGSEKDSMGNPVYDPYKTTGSAGFDLDAIAVINSL